jgi:hypothetical protein
MPVRTLTLTPNTIATVTVPGEWQAVAVFNRATSGDVYAATTTGVDPAAGADDVFAIPPGARRELNWAGYTGDELRLVAPGANLVEVEFG